jgi:IS5 family transposase
MHRNAPYRSAPAKLVSLFEAHTEVIRKGKAAKPTEFCKMVKMQEARSADRHALGRLRRASWDSDLLLPALDVHGQLLNRMPYLVTTDAAFFTHRNELAAQACGIKRVAHPQSQH